MEIIFGIWKINGQSCEPPNGPFNFSSFKLFVYFDNFKYKTNQEGKKPKVNIYFKTIS